MPVINQMLILLQEALACIENQQTMLAEDDILTITSHIRFTGVCSKFSREIIQLLQQQPLKSVKVKQNEKNAELSACSLERVMLLQEMLAYIESQQRLLEDNEIVTVACLVKYNKVCLKLTREIVRLLQQTSNFNLQKSVQNNLKETNPFHEVTSSNGRPAYTCFICRKKFYSIHDVNRHHTIHTGEKIYPCEICKRRFSQKAILKRHTATHTKEKPFMCDICDQTFSRKTSLTRHWSVHTGEKPFPCSICGKSFSRAYSLHLHCLIHSGEQ